MKNSLRFLIFMVYIMIGSLTQAQSTAPAITSFTTTFTGIGSDALASRSARIPVMWTTLNRPPAANLIFEQILPDRSTINVELPRLIPYVASSGSGIAAPILPISDTGTAPTHIVLRVSLVSMLTGMVFDASILDIPIISGNAGSSADNQMPTLTAFQAHFNTPLDPQQLTAGSARIPVTWSAINRPLTANLVFEQILADRSVVNVELPRPWLWVNSSDTGMVAPVPPGAIGAAIVLRVRLVDLVYGRVYDQRTLRIPVQDPAVTGTPHFTQFATEMLVISAADVQAGTARIPVSWSLNNRPPNSNLVFEQILPDETRRNAELPRTVQLVASSGAGVVTAVMPEGSTSLVYQIRLLDLSSGAVLASSQRLIVTITGGVSSTGEMTVTGAACYQAPFPASTGLQIGGQGRIEQTYGGATVGIYSEPEQTNLLLQLNPGDLFTVDAGPLCIRPNGDTNYSRREWQVSAQGISGWVTEYSGALDYGYVFTMRGSDQPAPQTAAIISFDVSPDRVSSTSDVITVRWETRSATNVSMNIFLAGNAYWDNLASSGTLTINLADYAIQSNPFIVELNARDAQQNAVTARESIAIDSPVTIAAFSVTPASGRGATITTFSWQINGDFERGFIQWVPMTYRPSQTTITEISTTSGTYDFLLPDWTVGTYEITLNVSDQSGTYQTATTQLTITCAYDWGIAVSENNCPASPVQTRQGAYQVFEHGIMVWTEGDALSLWVLYDNGTGYRFSDQWDGSALSAETAPAGLLAPERGFGYLWRTESLVRSGLGWAAAPEQAYSVTTQYTLSPGRYDTSRWYLTLPDGRLIRVASAINVSMLTWQQVP